jgi:hypothetical protein
LKNSFTLTREYVAATDPDTLRASIVAETGSETGAESIMRSLERMGTDAEIEYFEMSQVAGSRRFGGAAPAGWRVRADRGITEEAQQ